MHNYIYGTGEKPMKRTTVMLPYELHAKACFRGFSAVSFCYIRLGRIRFELPCHRRSLVSPVAPHSQVQVVQSGHPLATHQVIN